MKRFLLIVTLLGSVALGNSCIFAAQAQNSDSKFPNRIASPRWVLNQEAQERPIYTSLWNGKGNWYPLTLYMQDGSSDYMGLTEDQSQRLAFLQAYSIGDDILKEKLQRQDPDLMQALGQMEKAIPPNDPHFDNATYEQQREFVTASEKMVDILANAINESVEQTLTPEQMTKVRELQLQLLPEMGFPSIAMFDTLGLTDEQRREMEAIKKEMEPEFNRLVDEAVEMRRETAQLTIQELAEMNKTKSIENEQQAIEAIQDAEKKANQNEELQKKQRLNSEKGQKFATRFKARLMNVLTDEQLDKMQKIIDDTPDFVKKILAEMNARRKEMEKEGLYIPGPDSWRPGDGAPEEFKIKRQGRFPKKK